MAGYDVIRFRVDEAERARIQALADRLAGGNMSRLLRQLIEEKEAGMMKKFYVAEFQTDEPIDLRVFAGFDRDEAVTEAATEWRHLTDREKAKRQLTVLAIDVPETCETVEDAEAWLDAEDRWGLGGEPVLELGR